MRTTHAVSEEDHMIETIVGRRYRSLARTYVLSLPESLNRPNRINNLQTRHGCDDECSHSILSQYCNSKGSAVFSLFRTCYHSVGSKAANRSTNSCRAMSQQFHPNLYPLLFWSANEVCPPVFESSRKCKGFFQPRYFIMRTLCPAGRWHSL
jgi:hypothetical protein